MDFSSIPSNKVFGRMLRLPLRALPSNSVMPILQGRMRGKKWIVGSSNHGCWLGSYEYDKRVLFEEIVKEGNIVFDIGAHVGFYTLLSSVLVGNSGKVFSFEPLPRNLFYLREHIRINHLINVILFDSAVADHEGMACFIEGISNSTGYVSKRVSSGKSNGIDNQEENQILIKTLTLDGLINRKLVPLPDFIKIDVEGGEMGVLLGAKSILKSAHPGIFLATHGHELHTQCCELLISLGYTLKPIGEMNIEETDEIMGYVETI